MKIEFNDPQDIYSHLQTILDVSGIDGLDKCLKEFEKLVDRYDPEKYEHKYFLEYVYLINKFKELKQLI